MARKVLKFGGSSVASADRIERVAAIVGAARSEGEVIVVVSALGGVTDALGRAAEASRQGTGETAEIVGEIERRHLEVARKLVSAAERDELAAGIATVLGRLREFLHGIELVGEVSRRSLDRILACGELLSAPMVAAALRERGLAATAVDARELIVTDSEFGAARPDLEATRARVGERLETASVVPVVTGFVGANVEGETTTLGRGGSDFTASILGVAAGADAVELWTDVDGVMSADPSQVAAARTIPHLRYEELMELSHFGAKVVHPPSVHPLRAAGIPLWIRNTFEPENAGTLVHDDGHDAVQWESPVRGITSIPQVAMARLEGDGMVGVPGVAMRLFGALARRGISVILITQGSSEHSICFAVAPEDLAAARDAVEVEFELDRRAGDIDELDVEEDMAVVAVVGAAMRDKPGIAGQLFSALGAHRINVSAIAQGSSELNISVVIQRDEVTPAVRVVHETFFEAEADGAGIFLAGVGGVGTALLGQLAEWTRKGADGRLRLEGLADSRRLVVDRKGLNARTALERLRSRPGLEPGMAVDTKAGGGAGALAEAALASPSSVRIFVDCTAADDMGPVHERLLAAGVEVVTANKKSLAGELEQFERIRSAAASGGAALYHEATVGAGLPVVRTLEGLLATGDELIRVEGVLSGTASFLSAELTRGSPFSDAVRHAGELGYTEPDPRDDLGGEDVARKLLILARLVGVQAERGDLDIQPWLPAEPWLRLPPDELLARLPELDPGFRARLDAAAESGSRLTYLASWEASGGSVALVETPPGHPCFDLAAGENLIAFYTRRYAKMPLVVRGPGAGPEVTAAGVFADILRACAERRDGLGDRS